MILANNQFTITLQSTCIPAYNKLAKRACQFRQILSPNLGLVKIANSNGH